MIATAASDKEDGLVTGRAPMAMNRVQFQSGLSPPAAVKQHVDTPVGASGVSHCRYCDFRFAADHKADQKTHREIHESLMAVEEKLGYRPGTYVERERMKKAGYHLMEHGEHGDDRVSGLLRVTHGWFDRSLRSAIEAGYWTKHPTFEVYVAMMVPYLETMSPV